MDSKNHVGLLVALLLLFGPMIVEPVIAETLRVGTIERKPFSMKRGTGYIGYSIELWDDVATENALNYEVIEFETFPRLLDAVQRGHVDAAVANITVTAEREERLDFSHTIFDAGLQIMVPKVATSSRSMFSFLANSGLYALLGIALLVLFAVAHAIWFIERGRDGFRSTYLAGVWDGLWWATVTFTSVGYGDQTPKSTASRILAVLWMLFGVLLASLFVAKATEILVTDEIRGTINSFAELRGRNVGTMKGSTGEEYLRRNGVDPITFSTPAELYQSIDQGMTEAVVFDAPILHYYVLNEGKGKARMVGTVFNPESFAFALASGSEHLEAINKSLLKLQENGRMRALERQWFGAN